MEMKLCRVFPREAARRGHPQHQGFIDHLPPWGTQPARKEARRGRGSRPLHRALSVSAHPDPDSLTTATAPRPAGVASAKIVDAGGPVTA